MQVLDVFKYCAFVNQVFNLYSFLMFSLCSFNASLLFFHYFTFMAKLPYSQLGKSQNALGKNAWTKMSTAKMLYSENIWIRLI